jgi:hypothetical protein
MLPYRLYASADLARALVRQGRSREACELARTESAELDRIDRPVCTEVLFRVAMAEVFLESGQKAEAEAALSLGERQLTLRADRLTAPGARMRFLGERPENREAVALSRRIRGAA